MNKRIKKKLMKRNYCYTYKEYKSSVVYDYMNAVSYSGNITKKRICIYNPNFFKLNLYKNHRTYSEEFVNHIINVTKNYFNNHIIKYPECLYGYKHYPYSKNITIKEREE